MQKPKNRHSSGSYKAGIKMSYHVFPKKVASMKKHGLPLPQSWEGVLSVECISSLLNAHHAD